MESTKTTKITISLSVEEIKVLQKATEVIKALRDEADEAYSFNGGDADEVLLTDLTSSVIDDLSYMLEDVTSLCK